MAEIISWLKVIGYVSVPIVLFLAVSWSVKNYKTKYSGLEVESQSEKITHIKPTALPSEQEKTSNIVEDNYLGELSGQMELERRRFVS